MSSGYRWASHAVLSSVCLAQSIWRAGLSPGNRLVSASSSQQSSPSRTSCCIRTGKTGENKVNPTQPTSAETSKATPSLPRINWVVFLVVLLTPALLTILVVLIGGRDSGAAPAIAFLGGGIAGIICGAMLGRCLGRTTPLKIVLGVVFAVVFSVVCMGMSCFGCLASVFHLDFR